jgi:phosphopantetheinyl transferase
MISLWIADTDTLGTLPRALLNILDRGEEEKAALLRKGTERRRYLVSRILLRQALSRVIGGDPRSWRFIIGVAGKVSLAYLHGSSSDRKRPFVDFSISHSGTATAVAISTSGNVGIDLERMDTEIFGDALEHLCTPKERTHLESLPEKRRTQERIRLWCIKEAYAKERGLGLTLDFSKLDALSLLFSGQGVQVRELMIENQSYTLAVASTLTQRNTPVIQIHEVASLDDLTPNVISISSALKLRPKTQDFYPVL